jgi:sugar lactone lactonase YvrE
MWAGLIVLGGWAAPPRHGQATDLAATANRVFGQSDFMSGGANYGGANANANSLSYPNGAVVDRQGDLIVADNGNNRVLEYDAPLTSGMAASRVFGQPDTTQNTPNNGGLTAKSLAEPHGVALDQQGNLYVADYGNSRVLEYVAPLTSSMAASRVFGQPDFSHNTPNNGVESAASLYDPIGVALDGQGNLYVADSSNNRVLEYTAPLTSSMAAKRVIGQPDFSSSFANNGGLGAKSLNYPNGVELGPQGDLYVADTANNRVLEYVAPLTDNAAAGRVFGQPDFNHSIPNNGGVSAATLWAPIGLALGGHGDLFVTDYLNNRVLEYDTPLATGMAAGRVLGQPNFSSNVFNNGGISASSLGEAAVVTLDGQGNLYVADTGNSRVLEYGPARFKLYLPLVRR